MSIRFENTVTPSAEQWRSAIMGARNPMNSWEKSDSIKCYANADCPGICEENMSGICIGPNDYDLMKRLRNAGTDHRKFMRMLPVMVTITAPLYWWKEFDTYKVGTVANSCSTMHKIHAKEFTLEDFSCEHLFDLSEVSHSEGGFAAISVDGYECHYSPDYFIKMTCDMLNHYRELYLETKDKKYWWQMIQLLPSSYNQKRTVMMNYEVLANIYKSRKNHKLDEWCLHGDLGDGTARPHDYAPGFCDWIKTLPYSELITGDWSE